MSRFTVAPPSTREEPDGAAMPAAALDRPPIRLARRHRLSRARGLVVGIVAGLILWSVIAGLLYGWL